MPRRSAGGMKHEALLKDLKAIKQIVERLEGLVTSSEGDALDPHQRRRRLLKDIYVSGNSVASEELEPMLRSQGTDYRWIAQQKKKGYLAVLPLPGGGKRYAVTPKAVRELRLARDEEGDDQIGEAAEPSE